MWRHAKKSVRHTICEPGSLHFQPAWKFENAVARLYTLESSVEIKKHEADAAQENVKLERKSNGPVPRLCTKISTHLLDKLESQRCAIPGNWKCSRR